MIYILFNLMFWIFGLVYEPNGNILCIHIGPIGIFIGSQQSIAKYFDSERKA